MTSDSNLDVILTRCDSYAPRLLAERLQSVLARLELPAALHGRTVLLKPNLISSRGPALACTNSNFLATVARLFHDQGAKVRIGDSPAFGTTGSVMAKQGMLAPLKGLPVEPILFRTPVPRTIFPGVTIEIAAEAMDCDFLVNLPKLKAHNQMYISCAVKNFFGTVVGMRKAMLHMRHGRSHREFAEILLALPGLMGPHLSLVDGIDVMHRSGPLDGERLRLGCIAGAFCPVALDTACLDMLELEKSNSPLWLLAQERGYPGSRSNNICYPLENPGHFHGSGFAAPAGLNPVRFSLLRLLVGAMRRLKLAIRP